MWLACYSFNATGENYLNYKVFGLQTWIWKYSKCLFSYKFDPYPSSIQSNEFRQDAYVCLISNPIFVYAVYISTSSYILIIKYKV